MTDSTTDIEGTQEDTNESPEEEQMIQYLQELEGKVEDLSQRVDSFNPDEIAASIEAKITARDDKRLEEMAVSHKKDIEAIKEEIKNILHGTG